MDEDASACDLIFLDGIGDGNLAFGDEPHVAIDAPMIGEIERHLFLAWRVGLVIAVVGLYGDDKIVANSRGQRNGDRQIAAFVVLDLLAIYVDGLLAHNGLKMEGDVTTCTLLRQAEVFTIPGNALIVTTTTGLSGHQLHGMGRRDYLPRFIVKVLGLSTSDIAQMEAPACIEVPYQTPTIIQREEACDGRASLCPLQREGESR